jgi:hypothetical protein
VGVCGRVGGCWCVCARVCVRGWVGGWVGVRTAKAHINNDSDTQPPKLHKVVTQRGAQSECTWESVKERFR